MGSPDEKTADQAVMLANRLEKQYKHLRKWARRTGVSCYRLYDKDIPEIPLAVDLYQESGAENRYLHVALYERPYEKPDDEEERWMESMKEAASDILDIPVDRIFAKIRKRQRGEDSQYERVAQKGGRIVVDEGGSKFLVNLSDYLDTGIFLDHRPARLMVRAESASKNVLNLFCYTGAFSVHAAAGDAASVTSVDLSKTYLAWAAENLNLNGFRTEAPEAGHASKTRFETPYPLVHADVKAFLAAARREGKTWDIIVIGGGATGLGIAVDAASRGYKTLLLEQSDFAKGTSSRSTKLVHGGVRYLQQGDMGMVIEALKERGLMIKNAPHLVTNRSFVIPSYEWWGSSFYTMGLKLYDMLAGKLGLGSSK
ncbi:MAG TPA: FAD-dependent oxidoreductase, partial [Treponemataceae bacterium]|nr:FAD-dependent oxidoreductase [Treponemataceae bacterium]